MIPLIISFKSRLRRIYSYRYTLWSELYSERIISRSSLNTWSLFKASASTWSYHNHSRKKLRIRFILMLDNSLKRYRKKVRLNITALKTYGTRSPSLSWRRYIFRSIMASHITPSLLIANISISTFQPSMEACSKSEQDKRAPEQARYTSKGTFTFQ